MAALTDITTEILDCPEAADLDRRRRERLAAYLAEFAEEIRTTGTYAIHAEGIGEYVTTLVRHAHMHAPRSH